MDLRCERCKTLYELDDARVSEAGTTVRCTSCGHVFRVRKKVLLMTEAVGASGEFTAVPPPVVEKPAWRVRSPSGRVIAFRELTSMQKWIVERKFARDDEISLQGDTWKRLGDIAELQPFFLLLEEVDRIHALEERLHRAGLADEAPEPEPGAPPGATPPEGGRPARTPIQLDTPLDPEPAASSSDPRLPASEPTEPLAASDRPTEPLAAPDRPTEPLGVPDRPTEPLAVPDRPTEPARAGTPAAFSLADIGEASLPSPDDLILDGTVEPKGRADEADQPAGLGVDPGVVDDWGESPERASKAPWVAVVLTVAGTAVAAAAYFQIWVPAQEDKIRHAADRVRIEQSEKARALEDADVQERERRAKEELLAGMAGRADAGATTPAGTAADAGTGASADPEPRRGSVDPGKPATTMQASMTATIPAGAPLRSRPAPPPEARARTFEDWMAQGDRERAHARARSALDAYQRAIALQPARPEAHLARGIALLDLGDPRSAVRAFRRTLEVNPRYSVADFWLGEAYRRAGQAPEAVEAYGRYLEAAPEGAEAARARQALNGLQ